MKDRRTPACSRIAAASVATTLLLTGCQASAHRSQPITTGTSATTTTSGSTSAGSPSGGSAAPTGAASPPMATDTAGTKATVTLTFWTWLPQMDKEAKLYESTHPGVRINVVNVGQGPGEYQKLRTAFKAGAGGPDLAQVEYQLLPSFEVTKDLLDLSKFGATALGADYDPSVWSLVSAGASVYAVPQDTGPMALIYRKDLFAKAGLSAPTTWAQFATDASKIHASTPGTYITDLAPNEAGQLSGLFWQAGSQPFSATSMDSLSIHLDDAAAQKVGQFWQPLIAAGTVATDPDFTNDWYAGLASGKYASWITGAWGPLFLQGVAKGTAGKWAVAPLPGWAAGSRTSANWGGSSTAVTAQTKHPAQAADFAEWLNHAPESVALLESQQSLFPALTSAVTASSFVGQKSAFFGGQQVNQVFAAAASQVAPGWQWSPFQDFVYSTMLDTVGKAMTGKTSWTPALQALQGKVAGYASSEGFHVKAG